MLGSEKLGQSDQDQGQSESNLSKAKTNSRLKRQGRHNFFRVV